MGARVGDDGVSVRSEHALPELGQRPASFGEDRDLRRVDRRRKRSRDAGPRPWRPGRLQHGQLRRDSAGVYGVRVCYLPDGYSESTLRYTGTIATGPLGEPLLYGLW